MSPDEPKADEQPDKAFKVLTDEESKAAGLPTEPTQEDIEEGERARAKATGHVQPKQFSELSAKTRNEMAGGNKRLGGGGLSVEEAYNKSLHDPAKPVEQPTIHLRAAEPQAEPTERSKKEMEAGKGSLDRVKQQHEESRRLSAEQKARDLEAGKPANPATDLAYNERKD